MMNVKGTLNHVESGRPAHKRARRTAMDLLDRRADGAPVVDTDMPSSTVKNTVAMRNTTLAPAQEQARYRCLIH